MWRNDASTARTKLILRLVAATFVVVTVLMVEAKAQSDLENQTEIATPLEPLRPGVTESQLFAEIDAHTRAVLATAVLPYCPNSRTCRIQPECVRKPP